MATVVAPSSCYLGVIVLALLSGLMHASTGQGHGHEE